MSALDLISLTHNALNASGSRWTKVDYRHILDLDENGLVTRTLGSIVELDDGHQWIRLSYRVDSLSEEQDDEFVVESIDPSLLKGLVHVRQGMDQCKGTLNRFLDVVLDRVRHHEFDAKLVSLNDNVEGRKPCILRFANELGTLTITRMDSAKYAMARHNVESKKKPNQPHEGFWKKLCLRWRRKSRPAI